MTSPEPRDGDKDNAAKPAAEKGRVNDGFWVIRCGEGNGRNRPKWVVHEKRQERLSLTEPAI